MTPSTNRLSSAASTTLAYNKPRRRLLGEQTISGVIKRSGKVLAATGFVNLADVQWHIRISEGEERLCIWTWIPVSSTGMTVATALRRHVATRPSKEQTTNPFIHPLHLTQKRCLTNITFRHMIVLKYVIKAERFCPLQTIMCVL